MKKKMLAFGAAAAALAFVPAGIANATTSTSKNSVSINQYADYDFVGTNLDVGLQVRCSGGSGTVDVTVSQRQPETPYPVASGTGPQLVVCDGQTHSVAVTIVGFGFDAGKAKATALLVAPSGTKTASQQISIRVV
jgi:hypothetical protein